MKRNEIYIIHGTDYRDMTKRLLAEADLAGQIRETTKGKKDPFIGLKPNLVNASDPSMGATTHGELLEGALEYLLEQGFTNLTVMEGSWVGETTGRALKAAGYEAVLKRFGVPFFDLQRDSARDCDAAGMTLKVCDLPLKADFMINMPVLKGHCQTQITCALKNNKGTIPNSEKRRFHTMGLHKPIAHLNTVVRNDFILVDNICGDLDFEEGGNPVPMDRILAFADPVLCDAFVCDAMGIPADRVPYIAMAERLGVGRADLSAARIHTLNQPEARRASLRRKGRIDALSRYIDERDACSACFGSLIHALNRLDEDGLLKRGMEKRPIAIGQGWQGKAGETGVGRCTGCFKCSLKGCPPRASEILEFLKEHWL